MQGDLRTRLRQIHQLPMPVIGYLPLWLETLRLWLDADGVAALWCHAQEGTSAVSEDGSTDATCWYAPQAPLAACERLAASGWTMPSVAELQHALPQGRVMSTHQRQGRAGAVGAGEAGAALLPRPAALAACLPDGDLLDVCLLPAQRIPDTPPPYQDVAPIGALRLLVSRRREHPRFTSREIAAFETAAAGFATVPERAPFPTFPTFPPHAAMTSAVPDPGPEVSDAIGADITGTLVWHRRQPEWADPAALALMRRVWRLVPGRAWPDACVVVQACQRLADELMLHPCDAPPAGAQVCASVPVPGGTLHLHATHLCGMGGSATERVRIALHLAVPPAVRLLQRLWETALTPVQREIAMRLLAGQSRTQTREACAIGVQTLKTHLSLMRARLDPVRDASLLLGLGGQGVVGGWQRGATTAVNAGRT
ncbi:hypothetical protein PCA20602_01926 [Pandoraea capi]|uniref:Helix-turn-helix transcriptional regulator n=1 Tax=Pandoraea capi TaxID=2508286 RepID=A0ABY6VWH9_9BURK|nr:hypothetical protein [Pandoraea capi]VVD96761.1 hypothetical protein PCA20602_01926 [Pandoraea capi]